MVTYNIEKIQKSLKDFKTHFKDINKKLSIKRDFFDDTIYHNILEGYKFINGLLYDNIDIFSPAGLHSLLELNHLILCGTGHKKRIEFHKYILETRSRFYKRIPQIMKWYHKAEKKMIPESLATAFYIKILSNPQLFIEGNHRTANILINYILAARERGIMILNRKNAHEYLEVSGSIKFSNKDKIIDKHFSLPGFAKVFKNIIEKDQSRNFLNGTTL